MITADYAKRQAIKAITAEILKAVEYFLKLTPEEQQAQLEILREQARTGKINTKGPITFSL